MQKESVIELVLILAVGLVDNSVRIFDVKRGLCLSRICVKSFGSLSCVEFFATGNLLLGFGSSSSNTTSTREASTSSTSRTKAQQGTGQLGVFTLEGEQLVEFEPSTSEDSSTAVAVIDILPDGGEKEVASSSTTTSTIMNCFNSSLLVSRLNI